MMTVFCVLHQSGKTIAYVRQSFFFLSFPQKSLVAQAVLGSACWRGWPWTSDPPACFSRAVSTDVRTTQGPVWGMNPELVCWQAQYQLNHLSSSWFFYILLAFVGCGCWGCSLCSPGCCETKRFAYLCLNCQRFKACVTLTSKADCYQILKTLSPMKKQV